MVTNLKGRPGSCAFIMLLQSTTYVMQRVNLAWLQMGILKLHLFAYKLEDSTVELQCYPLGHLLSNLLGTRLTTTLQCPYNTSLCV